jgi:hypothetical protein
VEEHSLIRYRKQSLSGNNEFIQVSTTEMKAISAFVSPYSHTSVPTYSSFFGGTRESIQEFNNAQIESSIQITTTDPTLTIPFEPILPDTTTLVGFGILTILCVIAAFVWSNDVVPVSRSKLAISKSRGDVKAYLDDLNTAEDRPFQTWLFNDWLTNNKSRKQPAIPILKRAKWNSGDNPVVVTAAIMMVGIIIACVTERIL